MWQICFSTLSVTRREKAQVLMENERDAEEGKMRLDETPEKTNIE